jgi:putative Holliday junction resolvase
MAAFWNRYDDYGHARFVASRLTAAWQRSGIGTMNTATPDSPPAALPRHGSVLAFDFGEKRIGVASGDLALRIAHPLTTIEGVSNEAKLDAIAALVSEWRPALFVVGMPAHEDGRAHALAPLVRKFAQRLQGRFKITVEYCNEQLSSNAAQQALSAQGVQGKRQKAWLDRVAAQVILQSFFDALPRQNP